MSENRIGKIFKSTIVMGHFKMYKNMSFVQNMRFSVLFLVIFRSRRSSSWLQWRMQPSAGPSWRWTQQILTFQAFPQFLCFYTETHKGFSRSRHRVFNDAVQFRRKTNKQTPGCIYIMFASKLDQWFCCQLSLFPSNFSKIWLYLCSRSPHFLLSFKLVKTHTKSKC